MPLLDLTDEHTRLASGRRLRNLAVPFCVAMAAAEWALFWPRWWMAAIYTPTMLFLAAANAGIYETHRRRYRERRLRERTELWDRIQRDWRERHEA